MYKAQDYDFLIAMQFARLYMMVSILVVCGKHLYDHIISLIGEIRTHETSKTVPLFISARTKPGKYGVVYLCSD